MGYFSKLDLWYHEAGIHCHIFPDTLAGVIVRPGYSGIFGWVYMGQRESGIFPKTSLGVSWGRDTLLYCWICGWGYRGPGVQCYIARYLAGGIVEPGYSEIFSDTWLGVLWGQDTVGYLAGCTVCGS